MAVGRAVMVDLHMVCSVRRARLPSTVSIFGYPYPVQRVAKTNSVAKLGSPRRFSAVRANKLVGSPNAGRTPRCHLALTF